MKTEEFAPAKVNLALHVTGQRGDGYHLLDSLVMFADVGDLLTAEPAPRITLAVTGPMAAGVPCDASNLVWRAAALFDMPVRMTLEKHLPAAAGIGGGSSDAAAAIRALRSLTGRQERGPLLDLGADLPVCIAPRAARMRGIGERVDLLDLPALDAVLVNPRVPVSTPAVFKALTKKDNPPLPDPLPGCPDARALMALLAGLRNDLELAACAVQPVITTVLSAISAQPGARLSRMSGSGATCFGLFASAEDAAAAAAALSADHPGWWVRACRLR